jgi:hypothetical protein
MCKSAICKTDSLHRGNVTSYHNQLDVTKKAGSPRPITEGCYLPPVTYIPNSSPLEGSQRLSGRSDLGCLLVTMPACTAVACWHLQ